MGKMEGDRRTGDLPGRGSGDRRISEGRKRPGDRRIGDGPDDWAVTGDRRIVGMSEDVFGECP